MKLLDEGGMQQLIGCLEARVLRDTGVAMKIAEKELYRRLG